MALEKSFKVICIKIVLFLGVLAIATHLTVTFWEYFVLRTELSKINSSLHVLKDTLSIISSEYDKVSKDLSELSTKQLSKSFINGKRTEKWDENTFHDIKVEENYAY
ncbi:unnamed protein product [Parnassius mnemosyne]|uniref:Uncharacterized protein n=1 Tax=Parnassius mnemosyne TaxID=213953 RepID=A0AAV1LLR0_9NEOP